MTASNLPILTLLLGGCLLLFSPLATPTVPPAPVPVSALQTAVKPITDATFTAEDAAAVGEFCSVFADVLADDAVKKQIADTGELRDRLQQSSRLMFQQSGIDQRHPSLPDQINVILAGWMKLTGTDGVQVVPLDGDVDRRSLAIEALQAVAWGVTQ